MQIRVQGKKIGDKDPAFIIAEFGINHNGSLDLAIKMVREAAKAGVDAIKLQFVNPEESYSKNTVYYSLFKKCCLGIKAIRRVRDEAEKLGLIFFATAGDLSGLGMLMKLKIPIIKISSGCMTNVPLIRNAAATGLPIIISTGMSYLREVKMAISELEAGGAKDIVILHCVSNYPASYEDINLNSMKKIRDTFKYTVGYSDHTKDELTALVAVAMGAKVIEKHFTLDRKLEGPDHHFSASPETMARLISDIRIVEQIMGSDIKKPSKKEEAFKMRARRFIVAAKNLRKGCVLCEKDIAIKRLAGTGGLYSEQHDFVVGRKLLRDVRKDAAITAELIKLLG